jgi:hypothetical protein
MAIEGVVVDRNFAVQGHQFLSPVTTSGLILGQAGVGGDKDLIKPLGNLA